MDGMMVNQNMMIASGEYAGTDVLQHTLTFPFKPKIVFIGTSNSSRPIGYNVQCTYMWGATTTNSVTDDMNVTAIANVTVSENSMTFTGGTGNSPNSTLNAGDVTYRWVAIG